MLRSATHARKPSTKSGTIGARRPSPDGPDDVIRWTTLTAATTGASMTTRVSLTTTAVASTAAPAGLAAATTWPTSWTLAPAQAPNCWPVSPRGPWSSGSSTSAIVPNRVTMAMATVTSSSSAPAVSSMAAMAEAPQIAVPVPMSRLRDGLRPIRRPTQVVTTRVPTRLTATTAMSGRPSAAIEPKDTEKPSRTMPTRRSFLVTRASGAMPRRGRIPMLAATTPRPIDQVSTPTAGTSR